MNYSTDKQIAISPMLKRASYAHEACMYDYDKRLSPLIICTQPLVSPMLHTKSFRSPKFLTFNKFLNRYQACLYLFEYISHGEKNIVTNF